MHNWTKYVNDYYVAILPSRLGFFLIEFYASALLFPPFHLGMFKFVEIRNTFFNNKKLKYFIIIIEFFFLHCAFNGFDNYTYSLEKERVLTLKFIGYKILKV